MIKIFIKILIIILLINIFYIKLKIQMGLEVAEAVVAVVMGAEPLLQQPH